MQLGIRVTLWVDISAPGTQDTMFFLSLREMKCRHFFLTLRIAFFFILLGPSTWLHAETLSGRVVDQSGAVIVGARVEISGEGLVNPVVLQSDGQGRFSVPDLKPGTYSLRVERDGFEPLIKSVDLNGSIELLLEMPPSAFSL